MGKRFWEQNLTNSAEMKQVCRDWSTSMSDNSVELIISAHALNQMVTT